MEQEEKHDEKANLGHQSALGVDIKLSLTRLPLASGTPLWEDFPWAFGGMFCFHMALEGVKFSREALATARLRAMKVFSKMSCLDVLIKTRKFDDLAALATVVGTFPPTNPRAVGSAANTNMSFQVFSDLAVVEFDVGPAGIVVAVGVFWFFCIAVAAEILH